MDYEATLDAAFADPRNTAAILPPSDVNAIIKRSYEVDSPFTYTRVQLWDMEVKKAHDPETYLYHLVRPGSVRILQHRQEKHLEYSIRISDQRTWKNPSVYTKVIERVRLDHNARRAFFLGEQSVQGDEGRTVVAGKEQPIFHVEHSVAGSEEAPLNLWRIVVLTEARDEELVGVFEEMGRSEYLREFNEVYVERVLGRRIVRK